MVSGADIISRAKGVFAWKLVETVSATLLIVVLARLLDPSGYGLLFLTFSVLNVMMIGSKLGISASAARYVSEYKVKDPGQIIHIVRASASYNLFTICFVSGVLFSTAGIIANFVGEPELEPFLLVGVLYLIFRTITGYIRGILQGFEAVTESSFIQAIEEAAPVIFAIGFVFFGYGAIGALGGYIVSSVVAAVTGAYLMINRISDAAGPVTELEHGLRKRIAEYSVPITATSAADVVDKELDTVLIGFFLTPISVSYYVIAKQGTSVIRMPVKALGFSMAPSFSAEKANNNIEEFSKIYESAFIHTLLVYSPAAAGLIVVADPTINLVFGSQYNGAVPVLQILGIIVIFKSINNITTSGLDFIGRAKIRAYIKGGTSVLNFILNILLIPTIGVVGAALATVLTYSMYTLGNLYVVQSELRLRLLYLLWKCLHILTITAIMTVVVLYVSQIITGLFTLSLTIMIGVGIWAILSIITGVLDINLNQVL